MGMLLQLAGGIMKARAQRSKAIIAVKNAESESLTEGYNSTLRQRDRIQKFREQAATNRTRAAGSGIDAFSGSARSINQLSAGDLKTANDEDVFSTRHKKGQIKDTGKYKARAFKAQATATLLNTGASIANSIGSGGFN